ncbi:MAG: hypothetical protein AAF399_07400 [Bacteroidota bacterium]
MKNRRLSPTLLSLGLLSLGLLIYTGLRAALLSMTHDESSTYLNFIDLSIWGCLSDPECWRTANLHLLNSWLMQGFVGLFGPSEFWVRFPNLLAHALYLGSSAWLVSQWLPRLWPRIAGFLLLNANPYLLEFFSLGRGYGLAVGFLMLSVASLYAWIQHDKWHPFALAWLAAFLAVLSNFTYLNFVACLFGSLLILWVANRIFPAKLSIPSLKTLHVLMIAACFLLLAATLYQPIQFLRQNGEFEYGSSVLSETFQHLTWASLQGQGYLGNATATVLSLVCYGLAIIATVMGLLQWKQADSPALVFWVLISVMAALLIPGMVLQRLLFGTEYLIHRKALIFIPMFALPIAGWLGHSRWLNLRWQRGLSIAIGLFLLWHVSRVANLTHSREWHYDAQTKAMMEFVRDLPATEQPRSLGVHWLFSHSAEFYRQTWDLTEAIAPIPYEKALRSDSSYQYYYVLPEQVGEIHPAYQEVKRFGTKGVLLAK